MNATGRYTDGDEARTRWTRVRSPQVSPRRLRESLRAYRIGDPAGDHPVYSGDGSRMYPGRWNERGQSVIYTSEHYSTALLEMLARTGEIPCNQHYVEIDIPAGVTYEVVTKDSLPGWCDVDGAVARSFGSRWYTERRSAILIVPSVVARMEHNVLIHSSHDEASSISVGLETPVCWDLRLFGQ